MLSYKSILTAVDLSDASPYVIQRAHQMAQDSNARLSVVHVIEHSPVVYAGEFSIPIDANLEQTIESSAREQLAQYCTPLNIQDEAQYVMTGTVKHEVIELAKQLNADLLVLGSHSHHGLDFLLGSRANTLLHHTQCDTLVVRIPAPADA